MAKRGTLEHPKTLKLARRLGIEPWMAIGLLEGFWHWCSKYAITGEIKCEPEQIADGIRYGSDPQAMFDALVECGWVDCVHGRYFVHDVSQHADNTWKANLKRAGLEFATPSPKSNEPVATESQLSHNSVEDAVTTESQLSNEPPKPEPEPEPVKNLKVLDMGGLGRNGNLDPRLVAVVDHLNKSAGKKFPYDGQAKFVSGRLRQGSTVEQMCLVVDHRVHKWRGDPKMAEFLRPKTLFNRDNWDGYLQEAAAWDKAGRKQAQTGKASHDDWGAM